MNAGRIVAVQHHRAHVASVLAERGALDRRVLGVALDGTGFGDDGTIWGGEFFAGSVREGFTRVAHLREASLAGGDAAARHPVQAAAGFLAQIDGVRDFIQPPFSFPDRFRDASALLATGTRVFRTTSTGRLFDTVAALVGFTRPVTFEGQAAIWLEHVARGTHDRSIDIACHFDGLEIDWRELLAGIVSARVRGAGTDVLARAFHRSLGRAIAGAAVRLAESANVDTIVLSGGVAQNELLLHDIHDALGDTGLQLWVNHAVPPNDFGLSLGQAALTLYGDGAG